MPSRCRFAPPSKISERIQFKTGEWQAKILYRVLAIIVSLERSWILGREFLVQSDVYAEIRRSVLKQAWIGILEARQQPSNIGGFQASQEQNKHCGLKFFCSCTNLEIWGEIKEEFFKSLSPPRYFDILIIREQLWTD